MAVANDSYTIPHTDGDTTTEYTFKNDDNNIFTGQVTDMSSLFTNKETFNEDIGYWDTSRVTDMDAMFWGASLLIKTLENGTRLM